MKIIFSGYSNTTRVNRSNNIKNNYSSFGLSFGKYQSSKRFNDMPKDIYEPNKERYEHSNYAFKTGKDYDESCEKAKIKLIEFVSKDCDMDVKYQTKTIKKMREMLEREDEEAEYLLKLIDLVKNKKLPYYVLKFFEKDYPLRKEVKEDLDKLYEAYSKGIDAKDVFCPEFKNKKQAVRNIEIGEVCSVENEKNIFTKLPNGALRRLYISKDTYLKLFPPVERFSIIQSLLGDCSLLATIDSIYSNPNTRHVILEMFYEDSKERVHANVNGWRDENGRIIKESKHLDSALYNVENKLKKRIKFAPEHVVEEYEAARIIELLFAYNISDGDIIKKKNNIKGIYGEQAFQYFDFHGRFFQKKQEKELREYLSDEDFSKKYLAIAGSKEKMKDDKFEEGHAYSLQPVTINGERKIIVRNPHNASRDIIISLDEYFENFKETFIADINSRNKNIF